MKTLIASLGMALLVTGTSLATPHRTSDDKKVAMQTAVFASSATKLNVIVASNNHRNVSVRLLDKDGNILAQEFLSKTSKPTKVRFDLSLLQDGVYQVEISSRSSKEIKKVTLMTAYPQSSSRTLAMN